MAALIGIGKVVSGGTARRLDTARLRSELRGLGAATYLTYARTSYGSSYDVWIEANDNISNEASAKAVAAVVAQANRLQIELL